MRHIYFFSLLLALSASSSLAAPCSGLNARYEMEGAEGFSLTLIKAEEALAWSDLEAELKTPTRKVRFSFTASNGYSTNYLVRKDAAADADDKESSYTFYSFDEKLATSELPQSTTLAPALIFAPELGGHLWYGSEPREYLPIAMWRLKNCPP